MPIYRIFMRRDSCLYAQRFKKDDFNFIYDGRTIAQISQKDILGSQMVLLLVGRNRHWSLATANMRTQNIYHEDPVSCTHGIRDKN